ncbi:hypothetical protein [Sphaerisporangium fuscum]|uniref:hypothetical protein n=1 Tax=Sphaerisporangium fuscum TaxID=2835868 RepID=UPI001BDD1980|nr:hypothetical protein [Sphaerisporangium fuscum]
MSRDDDRPDAEVLTFPRVVLPGSLDAPGPDVEPDAPTGPADGRDGGPVPVGSWPRLPQVDQMAPPLHLTVPGTPMPELEPAADGEAFEDGAVGSFVAPSPADPDNPTARDVAGVALAVVTAMGVAAAQGMWHRARHRQALADQARAHADKAVGKAAAGARHASGSYGSTGSKGSRSPGAAHGSSAHRTGPGGAGRSGGPGKAAHGPHSDSRKGRPGLFGGPDSKAPKAPKAPKAARDGKTTRPDRDKRKRAKDGADDAGRRTRWIPGRARPGGKTPGEKHHKRGSDKGTPGAVPKAGRDGKTTWTDQQQHRRRKHGDSGKDSAKEPKRLTPGPTGETGGKESSGSKRRGRFRFRRLHRKSGTSWWKRWRARRRRSRPSDPTVTEATEAPETFAETADNDSSRSRRSRGRGRGRRAGRNWKAGTWEREWEGDPPPPPPRFEDMRPPPAGDRTCG